MEQQCFQNVFLIEAPIEGTRIICHGSITDRKIRMRKIFSLWFVCFEMDFK